MTTLMISIFANLVIGSGLFDKIKTIVQTEHDKLITGAEKRNNVVKELETIGINTAQSLINLGIELAVQWIKLKAK